MAAKLTALLDGAGLDAADRGALAAGLKGLRDRVAFEGNDLKRKAFVEAALEHVGRVLALLRTGTISIPGGGLYGPISPSAVPALVNDPNVAASGLPEFAVGMAILGHGAATGAWACAASTPVAHTSGAVRVAASREVEVFFAATAKAAAQLLAQGHVDTADDVVLIHSDPILVPSPRSSSATFGRTLKPKIGLREVSVRTVVDSGADAAGMVQRFKLELAL